MPAYNAARTIVGSVESVLRQEFENWELIVVDDRSTDETAQNVEALSQLDCRIHLIRQESNAGVAAARNRGIEVAEGRYIAFLDSDDYWLPTKLSSQVNALRAGAKVVHSNYYRRIKNGALSEIIAPDVVHEWHFYFYNPIGNLTGMYDRQAIGAIKQELVRHEDYLMWFQIVKKAGESVGINRPLAVYTVHSGSLSGHKIKAAAWHWVLLRKHMRLSLVTAIPGFLFYTLRSVFLRAKETFAILTRKLLNLMSQGGVR